LDQPRAAVEKPRESGVREHREDAEYEQRHQQLDQREPASAAREGLHFVESPCAGGVLPICDRSPVCETVELVIQVAVCSTKPVGRTSGTLPPGSITPTSTRRIFATGVTPVSCTQWNLRPPISASPSLVSSAGHSPLSSRSAIRSSATQRASMRSRSATVVSTAEPTLCAAAVSAIASTASATRISISVTPEGRERFTNPPEFECSRRASR